MSSPSISAKRKTDTVSGMPTLAYEEWTKRFVLGFTDIIASCSWMQDKNPTINRKELGNRKAGKRTELFCDLVQSYS